MNFGFGSSANRWRGVVLGAWAVGLAALLFAGRYSLFIRARLWPLLVGSLLILLFFLMAMVARPDRNASRVRAAAWVRGGMLLLPLLYMSFLMSGAAASGLNSFALQKRSLGLSSPSDSSAIGSDSNNVPFSAGETTNLLYIDRRLNRLSGSRVVTEGRVWKDDSAPDGELVVFRFVVVCCAADAMPAEAVVKSPKVASFKNDDWVRVGGILRVEMRGGNPVPVIEADRIDPINPPEEPYLSPF